MMGGAARVRVVVVVVWVMGDDGQWHISCGRWTPRRADGKGWDGDDVQMIIPRQTGPTAMVDVVRGRELEEQGMTLRST